MIVFIWCPPSVCLSLSLLVSLAWKYFKWSLFYVSHICPCIYVLHISLTCFFHIVLCYICMFILFVNLLEQRAPRKIGAKPVGLPSKNKELTYLLIYCRHSKYHNIYFHPLVLICAKKKKKKKKKTLSSRNFIRKIACIFPRKIKGLNISIKSI